MHIRAYRDSDLPLLCQIFLRAVRETASRDYTPGQIAAWAQVDETRWRQKLADSIGLVAVVNSQPPRSQRREYTAPGHPTRQTGSVPHARRPMSHAQRRGPLFPRRFQNDRYRLACCLRTHLLPQGKAGP